MSCINHVYKVSFTSEMLAALLQIEFAALLQVEFAALLQIEFVKIVAKREYLTEKVNHKCQTAQ